MWKTVALGFGDIIRKGDVILGQTSRDSGPSASMREELIRLRTGFSTIPRQPSDTAITNPYYKTVTYWVARKEHENEFGKVIP